MSLTLSCVSVSETLSGIQEGWARPSHAAIGDAATAAAAVAAAPALQQLAARLTSLRPCVRLSVFLTRSEAAADPSESTCAATAAAATGAAAAAVSSGELLH